MHRKIWLFAPILIFCFLIESSYAVRDGEWKVIAKGTTFKPTRIFFFDTDHGWLMQTVTTPNGLAAWGRTLSQGMIPQATPGGDIPAFDGL